MSIDVFFPDSCLQGGNVPAHITWDKRQNHRITIEFHDELEISEVFNSSNCELSKGDTNILEVESVDENGYLGMLFKSKLLTSEKRKTARVLITVTEKNSGEIRQFEKTIELFRPSIEVIDVPKEINIKIDEFLHILVPDKKIRLSNMGDGTAIIIISTSEEDVFRIGESDNTEGFRKSFIADYTEKLEELISEYPEEENVLSRFLNIFRKQNTSKDELELTVLESVFSELDKKFQDDTNFADSFMDALFSSYIKNIQLITDLTAFKDYLNSIGEGRVVLRNYLDVLHPINGSGNIGLVIKMTDLAYNEYDSIILPQVTINCKGIKEIPITSIIEWNHQKQMTNKKRRS